jgi:hypothetical protein
MAEPPIPPVEESTQDKPQSKPEVVNETIAPEQLPVTPIQQAVIENPTTVQPEESKTTNSEPQTSETMEVHHHGHIHEKKKWKEYLFQFLMLFLAITLGFFVENQREHYIERRRAKQYAGLLIADLKSDTSFFKKEANRLSGLQGRFDTLINLLRQPVSAANDLIANRLFYINYVSDATVITATYNQMKTSGSLRYIKNPRVIANLQEYYEIKLPRCIRSSERSLAFFQEYLLPFFINNVREVKSHKSDTLNKGNPVIIGRSTDSDQRLSNIIEKAQTILMIANRFYEPANRKAGELISMLKKEYRLK